MRWPTDHPVHHDVRLAPWVDAAATWCAGAGTAEILRYVPGRRISARVDHPDDGICVVKVFGGPRGRGNHRRLSRLQTSTARDHLPRSLGADGSGHLHRLTWVPGDELSTLGGDAFVAACRGLGEVTARLHGSGVELDRAWTIDEELDQLARRATARTTPLLDRARRRAASLAGARCVAAHRDLHPRQAVVTGGRVALIDLDEAAMAPPALDVGNFLAHLRADEVIGRRTPAEAGAAATAFLDGYGPVEGDVETWRWLSLLRLAGLADSRHGRPDWAAVMVHVVTEAAA